MITLTKAELDSLTKPEQELAKLLGLNLQKGTRKSHAKCTSGESYILVTTISCRLCGSLSTRTFQMIKQKSYLQGMEIPEVPSKEKLGNMKVKSSHYTVRCCGNCYSYLEDIKKEDLIQKFLSYISDGRNFLT